MGMKGGSATLITLLAAFIGAIAILKKKELKMSQILENFKNSIDSLYTNNAGTLAKLIDLYGETLKGNGNVRYLGTDDYGVLSLIDSSECPPTFGASFNDIRGFILDGWQDMDNRKGELE